LAAVDLFCCPGTEIVIAGDVTDVATQELIAIARQGCDPARTVLLKKGDACDGTVGRVHVPALKDKTALRGNAAAYVCHGHTCHAPVTSPADLGDLLHRVCREA